MKKRTTYSDEPMGKVRVVRDFLPSPEELALKDEKAKLEEFLELATGAGYKFETLDQLLLLPNVQQQQQEAGQQQQFDQVQQGQSQFDLVQQQPPQQDVFNHQESSQFAQQKDFRVRQRFQQ